MFRALLPVLLFSASAFAASDPILEELEKAKAVHAKEMARLRQNLLDDIDKIIRQTNDMKGGIDYMPRENWFPTKFRNEFVGFRLALIPSPTAQP